MAKYDDWDLRIAREAVEYNRANPDPEHAGAEQWAEERLAMIEAYFAEGKGGTATPVADEAPRSMPRGNGSSNYGGQVDGPTPAQERFIRSLCEERGLDADEVLASIKDKRAASKKIDELKAIKPQAVVRPATERQLAFLQDLLSEREHSFDGDLSDLHFGKASNMIEQLLQAPRTGKSAHGIRHGRYAFQPAEGQAQFYRVGQNGRIYVQAGPAEHPYNGKLNEALEAIKADPQAHAALYGQLIGACGRCGLPLTDETSRAAGLGPICSSKTDW